MDTNNLVIKAIESTPEVESTLTFLANILPHPMDQTIWNWEFTINPNQVVLTICKDAGVTVGSHFMLPVQLNYNNNIILTGKCENGYFLQKHRGKGLFEKIFNYGQNICENKNYKILWGFTAAAKIFEQKLAFNSYTTSVYTSSVQIGKPQYKTIKAYSPNSLKAILNYGYKYTKFVQFITNKSIFAITTTYKKSIASYTVLDTFPQQAAIDNLYAKLKQHYNNFVHIHINEAYINWRVNTNVNLQYSTKYFYKNNELVGYYILALKANNANLADFTAVDAAMANVMVVHLVNNLDNNKILNLNYFGNTSNAINAMVFGVIKKLGGKILYNQGLPFIYKTLPGYSADNTFLQNINNWYLTGLWTEGFSY